MAGRELGEYLVLLPEWEGWLRMDPFFGQASCRPQ